MLIELANLIFLLLLVAFVIFYVVAGDRFELIQSVIKALMPLALFGIPFLIRMKMLRSEKRERAEEGSDEITIYLTYLDKFKSEIFAFSTGIIVYLVAFIGQLPDKTDMLQALIAFGVFFIWQNSLFRKQ